ncbi:UNVERIFIED_CONTAM: hypothetical protein Scaly_0182300 [Sesamum calycinum]|uniref:Uncharacterized protein n=1 Tax=Sesamum calycinum TaxID=2727403 RepID=A0AAW2SYZ0_9LAMI
MLIILDEPWYGNQPCFRTVLVDDEWKDEISLSNVDDVLSIIRSDYEKAYFVTGTIFEVFEVVGLFTSAIYADECTFEDPTIKFQEATLSILAVKVDQVTSATNQTGKDLYARNLSLLLPFLLNPSIRLKRIEKGLDSEKEFIVASWKLRTYLRLPWKPLISVDGRTIYDLDEEFRIVRHVERWNISALEAIIQIFTPSSERPER